MVIILLSIAICASCASEVPAVQDPAPPTSVTNSSEAPSASETRLSDESVAFVFGRSYAFAHLYLLLNTVAQAEEKMRTAQVAARALGVSEPTLPSKEESVSAMRSNVVPDELLVTKGRMVSATFSLAVSVTDGWFGTALGSTDKQRTDSTIANIESHAVAAGVPTEVWKAQVDTIKARPTEENFNKIIDNLEKYYNA